jgi:hypothetical protein
MRKFISIIFILCFALTSCATLQGTTGPTCDTAKATLKQSQSMLDQLKSQGIVKGDAVTYWMGVNLGASLFLTANGCPA